MKTVKRISKKAAKKMVVNHNRRVRAANAKFDALKPAEKRVAIARDVLAQLDSKKLVAKNLVWLTGKASTSLFENKDIKKDPELQEILNKKAQCEGCALGGMFMCAVKRADDLKLSQLEVVHDHNKDLTEGEEAYLDEQDRQVFEEDAFNYLSKFFSHEQLELIETAFERGNGFMSENNGKEVNPVALNFAPDVVDADTRMRLIMQNVIVNKGVFKPSKQPVVTYVTPGFVG